VIEDYRKLIGGVNSNLEISGALEKKNKKDGENEKNHFHPRRP
jgi:hypothetical protein